MKTEAINAVQLTGKLSKNHSAKLAVAETLSFNNLFMTIQQTNQSKLDMSSADNGNTQNLLNFDNDSQRSQTSFGNSSDNNLSANTASTEQIYTSVANEADVKQINETKNDNSEMSVKERHQDNKENQNAKNSAERDNKTQTAEQAAQKTEKNNAQQSETKVSADETKAELQEKLKQLAKEKKGDNMERLLAEIAELMNISVNQLKTMLKKEGIDLSQIKAALEEGDSSKTDKLMKQLAFKISEISVKSKPEAAGKADETAKQSEQLNEGKQSAELSDKAATDQPEEFIISKEEIKTDSAESKKQQKQQDNGKIEITDTELLSRTRETLSDEELSALREKANNMQRLRRTDSSKEVKQTDDVKAQVSESNSEIMDKIKTAAAAQHFNQTQKLDGANDLSARSKSDSFMKMGLEASQKTEATQSSMPKFANNQNSNSFMFNQNGGQENGSAKLANLMRGSQTAQTQQTAATYKQTFEQMIKQIKIQNDAGVNQVEIQLQPEHLGKVKIDLLMEKGSVIAKFVSDNEQTKQLLESNMNQLKSALEEQGLKISGLEVSVNQENQYSNRGEFNSRGKGRGSKGLSGLSSDAEDGDISVDASGTVNGSNNYIDSRYSTVSYIA